jgi:hypothetical protein
VVLKYVDIKRKIKNGEEWWRIVGRYSAIWKTERSKEEEEFFYRFYFTFAGL